MGGRPFQVNRSKDKVTRAIQIFAVGARGILVDHGLQFLVRHNALLTGTCYRVKTPAYFLYVTYHFLFNLCDLADILLEVLNLSVPYICIYITWLLAGIFMYGTE